MKLRVCDSDGRIKGYITLGKKIGEGGEGRIYEIIEDKNSLAKIYHEKRRKGMREKIVAMLKNRPEDPMYPRHISFAWPENMILNESGDFLGFTMPYMRNYFHVHQIYSTDDRIKIIKRFGASINWLFLFTLALNFASVVSSIHKKGHVIGDINESNVLIFPNAFVTLIDCDSFFIMSDSRIYKSDVGIPEYTAPEILKEKDFSKRTEKSDRFAVSILIFKLLMLGFHPFHGRWKGKGEGPKREANIIKGRTPYFRPSREIEIPPYAPHLNILPDDVKSLFKRAFVNGHMDPDKRPTALEWFKCLKSCRKDLKNECINPNHFYFPRINNKCPWCEYAKKIGRDPFPPPPKSLDKIKGLQNKIRQINDLLEDMEQEKLKLNIILKNF